MSGGDGMGGLALAIFLVAFALPATLILGCLAAAVGLLFTRRRWLAVVPLLGAAGVFAVWFVSFGIEYVPRHTGMVVEVPEGVELFGIQFCEERGEPVQNGRIVVPPSGLATVRDPRIGQGGPVDTRDWQTFEMVQGATSRTVHADGYSGGPDQCTYISFWLGDPMSRPLSVAEIADLEALMRDEGLTLHQAVERTRIRL